MAKRRLNKKVALIGSAIFLVVVLGAILVILHLSRNPEEFIRDAEAALLAKDYKEAGRSFYGAYTRAKTDSLREEILFKLVKVYLETKEWPLVLGCWNEIIRVNPNNGEARHNRLKYFYILADSGNPGYWQRVREQASEFLEVAERADLLMENTAEWDVFETEEKGAGRQRLGPYLYLLRGRAALEMAGMGAVTDSDQSLAQAVDDLKKVQEFEPNNIDAYWYLAQAIVAKGEILASRGSFEERDKATEQAIALLEQAVEIADTDPRAHINLLAMKLTSTTGSRATLLKEKLRSLEPEYSSLADKFGSSAEVFAAISRFYSIYSVYSDAWLGPKNLDTAIETAEEAIRLDEENVTYAINAANLHYQRFSVYGQEPEFYKAIEIAKNALTLPDAQDTPGPRHLANMHNRLQLYVFLAHCYIEQILEPCQIRTESETEVWLTDAEQAVHEIEQISGGGEEPLVIKWRGMLELAKGDREAAIRKLYEAYEQFKAVKPPQPPWPPDPEFAQLSYTLAKVFKNTSEIGAVNEFLISAIYAGVGGIKPEALLDYVEVALRLNRRRDAIEWINRFEEYFGTNQRSQELRIRAYIGIGTEEIEEGLAKTGFEAAAEALADRPKDEPDTIKLSLALAKARIRQLGWKIARKQLEEKRGDIFQETKPREEQTAESAARQSMIDEVKSYRQLEARLLEKLLLIEPDSVEQASAVRVCRNYIMLGQISKAEDLVNQFLGHFPDNATALIYKQILSEPKPEDVSQERYKEIEEQVLSGIADPVRRAAELGMSYRRNNELEKAAGEFKNVLKITTSQEGVIDKPAYYQTEQTNLRRFAVNYLFDIALGTKDWELAEQITETVRLEDLDNSQGQVFATRLAVAKGEFKDALAKIDECLKQRPVFSYAYMLRSNINSALGNEHASLEDMRKAASLNPLDGTIAKVAANVLYNRDRKLGDNVSSAQMIETKTALETAIGLNPRDVDLLRSYAEYITPTHPLEAVAIRQDLQQIAPTINNAILLGQLATKTAVKETNPARKEALFDVAGSAFEQARRMDPNDRGMLYFYAEYFRARRQDEKATELLQESRDEKLLWSHHFQRGRYEDAKRILEPLYKSEAKDSTVIQGLLLIAEKTADREAVKKYSEELISLEDTVGNRLAQIQFFLKVGLVKEAEYKLQSFKEKHPNEPEILLLEAWLAMRQGQLKKALELTNRNLQSNQNGSTAWRLRGEINFFLADYDKAISDLKTSKSLSDEPATRISLAKAYMQADRYEDAITELRITIDEPGASLEARSFLELVYLQLGRKEALKRFYEETLEKFPDSVRWLNRAAAFAISTEEFDRAEQLYKKACLARRQALLDLDEEDRIRDVLYVTAFDGYLKALLAGAGAPNTKHWDPQKLDKLFEEGIKYKDSVLGSIAHLRMGQAKWKLGDKITAAEYFREAVDKAGTNEALASEVLLRMYLMLGSEEVSKYCKERLRTNPDSVAANFAMFNLAKINGQYDKALDYIDKCIELTDPDSPARGNYTGKKTEILTTAYERSSDKEYLKRAIADYESLLAKMPNNISVLNNLAYMLAENNERLPEALQYAKRALDARPNAPAVLDTYAYLLCKNDKSSQAVEFLVAAFQQYKQDEIPVPAGAYEHLGMIKEDLGAKDEALAAYKQALEVGADTLSQKAKQRINKAIARVSP